MPESFDGVSWKLDPQAQAAAQALPSMYLEVWYYAAREAIRNAAKYGRGADTSRPLHLTLALTGSDILELSIEDDGVGVHTVSASKEIPGQGLALHSTMMAVLGGQLTVENRTGGGTVIRLAVPNSISPISINSE
jgi:signal transduction histidine kinase